MARRTVLHLRADAGNVLPALRRIRELAGHGPEDADTAELVLAEVLNNIVEHAYDPAGAGDVLVAIRPDPDGVRFCVVDAGRPMAGLRLPDGVMPDTGVPVQSLAEGGWGWALIRAMTRQIRYRRHAGRNVLTFVIPAA